MLLSNNSPGRTALHIAVLKENEEVVEHFVNIYSEALKIGDNVSCAILKRAKKNKIYLATLFAAGTHRFALRHGHERHRKLKSHTHTKRCQAYNQRSEGTSAKLLFYE